MKRIATWKNFEASNSNSLSETALDFTSQEIEDVLDVFQEFGDSVGSLMQSDTVLSSIIQWGGSDYLSSFRLPTSGSERCIIIKFKRVLIVREIINEMENIEETLKSMGLKISWIYTKRTANFVYLRGSLGLKSLLSRYVDGNTKIGIEFDSFDIAVSRI